ncbi:MAG: accessory gene regulator B family protein [Bacteroides sp.]|nr:accessory gene regulator B family protein [Bacteroides sp.]MCM1548827.1 accessory gene regulator B family protein [Clostridium sp.]
METQIKAGLLKDEDRGIYRYGYTLVLETLLNIFVGIIIGLVFKAIDTIMIFWLLYIPLRIFCGGWHAEKSWQCLIVSNAVLILVIKAEAMMILEINSWLVVLLEILLALVLMILVPVPTKHKPIAAREKSRFKRNCIVILVIELSVSLFIYRVRNIIVITYSVLLISLIMQMIINRKTGWYNSEAESM